jgi:peptidyl-prolyl cis-trans isomerase B (cyclophilin B)
VTSNRDRQQRAAARARLEREMTLRAQTARRRQRRQAIIGAAAAVVVLVVGVVLLVTLTGGGKGSKNKTAASASASAKPTSCTWTPLVDPSASPAQPVPPEIKDVGKPPATGEPRSGTQTMTISTNLGAVKIAIDDAKTPCTAASFTYLASKKFFDNAPCHRLTNEGIFVLQCGDPSGSGGGGPSYRVADENLPTNRRPAYPEGSVAMANAGPGTNGSQFFIIYKDSELPANYTLLGTVTEGLDIVKQVAAAGHDDAFKTNPDGSQGPGGGHPKKAVTITSLTMSAPTPGGS